MLVINFAVGFLIALGITADLSYPLGIPFLKIYKKGPRWHWWAIGAINLLMIISLIYLVIVLQRQ
jgi:ABC-type multidrug transport system permease subunit